VNVAVGGGVVGPGFAAVTVGGAAGSVVIGVLRGGEVIGAVVGGVGIGTVVGGIGTVVGELLTAGLLVELVVRLAINVPDIAERARAARAPASSGVHPRSRGLVLSEIGQLG
jgi:hypothetical protein